jgi:hypothetical protein
MIAGAGCSKVWVRPGTTQYQFSQDKSHCVQRSAIPGAPPPGKGEEPSVDADKFEKCMEALGYERRSESSTMFY